VALPRARREVYPLWSKRHHAIRLNQPKTISQGSRCRGPAAAGPESGWSRRPFTSLGRRGLSHAHRHQHRAVGHSRQGLRPPHL